MENVHDKSIFLLENSWRKFGGGEKIINLLSGYNAVLTLKWKLHKIKQVLSVYK